MKPRRQILALGLGALAAPLPYAVNADAAAGGLMTYDADLSDDYFRAGLYVDKLLAGVDLATH